MATLQKHGEDVTRDVRILQQAKENTYSQIQVVLQKRMGGNDGRDAPFLLSLSSHSKEAGEEGNLPQDVSFFHATSLPLR